MLKSMTGYGRAKYEIDGREYVIEIKAVNNRYCDVSIKLPRNISYLEEVIKKEITNKISRGKIDVFVTFNNFSTLGKNININRELAEMYVKELSEVTEKFNLRDDISAVNIARFPDVLEIKNEDEEEKITEEIMIPLNDAINKFIEMKKKEGEKLTEDILNRLSVISKNVDEISKYSTGLIEDYVVKLENRIKELLKTDVVDKSRLEQEVVIFADKCSVEEEITRLKSHISQFKDILNIKDFITTGKKLDFIIQEMNRETNTIGSKANCLEITNLVIDVKTEIENVREQIQNIE